MAAMECDYGEVPRVLCCECGLSIEPNPSNMCINCIQSQIDITSGISQTHTIQFCKYCERYLNPPKYWVPAALESKELLEMCLKKIKGLNKVHLVDASWLWTEPHSRRLRIKLTVQAALFNDTSVQQSVVVDFTVVIQMCETCQKEQTGQPQWVACVQARQKSIHKRTLLHVEQLIMKHEMHKDATKIDEQPDGIDFFYGHKSHAQKLVDFLGNYTPLRWKASQELISHDPKSNTADVHWVYMVEIAPICKGDLVVLPQKYHQAMGGLGPVCVCTKVNSNIILVDNNLQVGQIPAQLYWKQPFDSWAVNKNLIEFFVLDIEVSQQRVGKYVLAEAQISKAAEVGSGKVYFVRTHLGGMLQPGDSVMGYFLPELSTNDHFVREYKKFNPPDIFLVCKKHDNNKGE